MNQNQNNLPAVIQTAITNQKIDLSKVNLILPTQTFGEVIGKYDKVTVELVQVNPDPKGGDVFWLSGGFVFQARPIMMFANAVGIIWDTVTTTLIQRTPTVSRAKATGAYRKSNGEWIPLTEEKTVDLEVFEEEQRMKHEKDAEQGRPYWKNEQKFYESWKTDAEKDQWINQEVRKSMMQYKKFRDERALTGAKERVVKKLLALKDKYSKEELQKPFAFPRITLDASKMLDDPKARQAAIEKMTGSIQSIFGPRTSVEKHEAIAANYEVVDDHNPAQIEKHAEEQLTEPQSVQEEGPRIPWEDETEEEKEIKAALKELKELSEIKHLHQDAKDAAVSMLNQEEPNLEAINALIDKINGWLKDYSEALRAKRATKQGAAK